MITQSVSAENGGQEGNWIAFLCFAILLIGALLLPYNREQHQHSSIEAHQVAITDLTSQPLSMIADLRLADEEIRYLFQTNQVWPTVSQLEQSWVAPFVKDKSWLHQGEHHWLQVLPGVYQSYPKKGGVRYLLNSQHNSLDIWIYLNPLDNVIEHTDHSQSVLNEPLQTSHLIQLGWTQVLFGSNESGLAHPH